MELKFFPEKNPENFSGLSAFYSGPSGTIMARMVWASFDVSSKYLKKQILKFVITVGLSHQPASFVQVENRNPGKFLVLNLNIKKNNKLVHLRIISSIPNQIVRNGQFHRKKISGTKKSIRFIIYTKSNK